VGGVICIEATIVELLLVCVKILMIFAAHNVGQTAKDLLVEMLVLKVGIEHGRRRYQMDIGGN